jgi:hypothetical protein
MPGPKPNNSRALSGINHWGIFLGISGGNTELVSNYNWLCYLVYIICDPMSRESEWGNGIVFG